MVGRLPSATKGNQEQMGNNLEMGLKEQVALSCEKKSGGERDRGKLKGEANERKRKRSYALFHPAGITIPDEQLIVQTM